MVTDIIGPVLIALGIICEIIAITGVFKFKHVLMRMHPAAVGDTLALLLVILGAVFLSGMTFTSLKLIAVLIFMWIAGPVATHMLSLTVYETDSEETMQLYGETRLTPIKKEESKEEGKEELNENPED